MQTLNFNVGTDQRGLVSDVQNFKLGNDARNWVQARQFEGEMRTVVVNVLEGTIPLNLTGTTIWFEGLMSDGKTRIIDAKHGTILSPSTGQFRFEFPYAAFATFGSYKQSFFKIVRDGKSIATLEFTLDVLVNLVEDGLVPLDYITPFQDLYAKLDDIYQKADSEIKGKVIEWQQQVTELITGLNGDYAAIQTIVLSLKTSLGGLEDKIKSDGLLTVAEMDPFTKEIETARAGRKTLNSRLDKMDQLGLTKMFFPKIEHFQEDCALLNLADKWILIDSGDDRDWANIKAFILEHTSKIDVGIISHYHRDHFGNVLNIIKDTDIKTSGMTWYAPPTPAMDGIDIVADALKNLQTAATADTSMVTVVDSDLRIDLDNLTNIQFLNSSEESYQHYYAVNEKTYNDYSMIALINYNNTDLLFAGDLQDGAINWITAHYADYLHPVDFLKIPHHGCDRSNLATFYTIIRPEQAIAMCSNNNYINASGTESVALDLLNALGSQVSYAFKSESNYIISQNSIKPRTVNTSLRGTSGVTKINYYVKPQDPTPIFSNGSQEHPFVTINEMLSYVQPIKGVMYNLHFMPGDYGILNITNYIYGLEIYCDPDVTFEKINIYNCASINFMTDVHIKIAGDFSVNIDRSTVVFMKKLINDDRDADISNKEASRFLYALNSNVSVGEIVSNNRSSAVTAAASSDVTVYRASGDGNLAGFVASTGTIYVNNLIYPFAKNLIAEVNGRVIYDLPWQDLTLANGFVQQDPVQFCIRDNQTYVRGSITNPNWEISQWIAVTALPNIAKPRPTYTYRLPTASSNGNAGTIVVQENTIRIRFDAKPDLADFNFSFPIF